MSQYFSSRLLNYVTPTEINGMTYTTFYSEVNTNFNVGDRIFIMNGYYDSDLVITNNKYDQGSDGYVIVNIDRCSITLNIPYTGQLPYNIDLYDQYIKVWHIQSQRQFDYINKLYTNQYNTGPIGKFEYGYTNNIIYTDYNFNGISSGIFGQNSGVTGPGFWARTGYTWSNINSVVNQDLFTFSSTYSISGFTNNNNLLIFGEDFEYYNGTGTSVQYSCGSSTAVNGNVTFFFSNGYGPIEISGLTGGSTINVLQQISTQIGPLTGGQLYATASGTTTTGTLYIYTQANSMWNGVIIDMSATPTNLISVGSPFQTFGNSTLISQTFFRQDSVYSYNGNNWEIDIYYKQPIISKLNMRNGNFITGNWNDGIFGTYYDELSWSPLANWTSGFFINSNWNGNTINSKSSKTMQSYYASINNGTVVQTTDFTNNKGNGYNYFLDSDIFTASIINGNFENCNIGNENTTDNVVDEYMNGIGITLSSVITSGGYFYDDCDIYYTSFSSSTIFNSHVENSIGYSTKFLNSYVNDSIVASSSTFDSSTPVNILSADLWSYIPVVNGIYATISTTSNPTYSTYGLTPSQIGIRGVLKLYISQEDFEKFNMLDTFYLTQINKNYIISNLTNDQKVFLRMETKGILDTFFNSEIDPLNQLICSLSSVYDNTNTSIIQYTANPHIFHEQYYFSFLMNPNNISLPSIDIDLGNYFAYYAFSLQYPHIYPLQYVPVYPNIVINATQSFLPTNTVNQLFLNQPIINSEFKSSVLDYGTFLNYSSYINRESHIINKLSNNNLNMSIIGTNSLQVILPSTQSFNDQTLYNGKNIWLDSISYINGTSSTLLNSRYHITSLTQSSTYLTVVMKDQNPNSVISGLTSGGYFTEYPSTSTFTSIHPSIIQNSTVNGSFLRRGFFYDTTVINNNFNNNDTSFNLTNLNILRIINYNLGDPNTDIQSGMIFNSFAINNSWSGGLFYNSIWNGPTFENGLFLKSYWLNGMFENGTFQSSHDVTMSIPAYISFTGSVYPYSYTNQYKNWNTGIFNGGSMYDSAWMSGIFNEGKFYKSDFYGGTWSGGILGDTTITTQDTTFGSLQWFGYGSSYSVWNGGVVVNAQIGGLSNVDWYGGAFNNGLFTSGTSSYANWWSGSFNGGMFSNNAQWKDGSFYSGYFYSTYGYTISNPTVSTQFAWMNGTFSGGIFGNADLNQNSTWYNGTFDGGIFQGRLWYNGIFYNGTFNGSGGMTADNGPIISARYSEESFNDSFTQSYYGLWNNGWVLDTKSIASPSVKIFTTLVRSKDEKKQNPIATLNNMLWMGGTFSHTYGTMNNSIWYTGDFLNGTFQNSSFNPFVIRLGNATQSFDLTYSVWENGILNNSNFYISEWVNGQFMNGTMSGAIWRDGIWYYGDSKNNFWQDGTWLNGNWDGSPFDYTTLNSSMNVLKGANYYELLNVLQANGGTDSIHINNAMTGSSVPLSPNIGNPTFSSGNLNFWTQSGTSLVPWTYSNTYVIQSGHLLRTITANNAYTIINSLSTTKTIIPENSSSSTSLFTLGMNYNVAITLIAQTSTASVNILIGTYSNNVVLGWPVTSPITLNYNYTYLGGLNQVGIQQVQGSGYSSATVVLLDLVITEIDYSYDFSHNNKIVNGLISGGSPNYGSTVSLPGLITNTYVNNGSGGSSLISVKYGSGVFLNGIWNFGVWNNGMLVNKENFILFSQFLGFIKVKSFTWNIEIGGAIHNFQIGQKVIIPNIVAYDINENRVLIKDILTVALVTSTNIVVTWITSNSIIRRIQQDDLNHAIPCTSLVLNSGAAFNGLFQNAIFSYFLFDGAGPYVLNLTSSYMIDGIFNGGGFNSLTYSLFDSNGNTFNYNTGLIQNMVFYDNNLSTVGGSFSYLSFIDTVGDFTGGGVVINRNNTFYSNTLGLSQLSSQVDYYNWPSMDVMTAVASFRSGWTNSINTYNMGLKYNVYTNFLGNLSQFNNYYNTSDVSLGLPNFISDGYTFSTFGNWTIQSNDNSLNSSNLEITSSNSLGTVLALDNISTRSIQSQRYSLLSFGIANAAPLGITAISIYNAPSWVDIQVNGGVGLNLIGQQKHVEYFYNRTSLDMIFIGYTSSNFYMNNLIFAEIDRIPFPVYGTYSQYIYNSIVIPNIGISPYSLTTNLSTNINNISLYKDSFGQQQFSSNLTSSVSSGSILVQSTSNGGGNS